MTQRSEVLKYLENHKKGITSMEAFQKFGATRLSAIVFDLRKNGHNIVSESKRTKDRYGHTTLISCYKLVS